tara:strand:- start:807 stop:1355 length:549 start_codon:yes stop_codon:yes gene_type:complete
MKNIFDDGFYKSQQLKKFGFKRIGKNVQISKNCLIVGIKNISILDNVRIDSFTSIIADEGYLKIGNNVHIGGHGHILCSGGVIVNNNCTISQGVKIYSQSDDYSGNSKHGLFVKNKRLNYKKGKVNIGEYTIIGAGSIILPNVDIANNSSIGALTLVNKNLKTKGIYVGIPCKKIRNVIKKD